MPSGVYPKNFGMTSKLCEGHQIFSYVLRLLAATRREIGKIFIYFMALRDRPFFLVFDSLVICLTGILDRRGTRLERLIVAIAGSVMSEHGFRVRLRGRKKILWIGVFAISLGMLFSFPLLADDDLAMAAQHEEAGFAAAEAESWCEAASHFLKAYRAAPTIDYVYNAAMAADYAGDRRLALRLLVLLLGRHPDSERAQEVNKRTQHMA